MNILKGIISFIISLVFVIGIFVIYSMIAEMADSRPFQEIEDLANLLFYMPVFIIYVTWFVCIADYFKPIKIKNKFKEFAKPDGEKFETTIDRSKKDLIQVFLIAGTVIGIGLILFYAWAESMECITFDRGTNWYKKSLREETEPVLKSMAQKLENHLSKNPKNIREGTWQCVFESDFECFNPERVALEKAMNFRNNFIMRFDNDFVIDSKVYEFWIDPKANTHFKIRYNPSKNERSYGLRIAYDCQISEFYIVNTRPILYHYREKFPYSIYMGTFEYDSKTDKCGFVYDNDWDNFKENYKWLIFLSVYILTAIICIVMVLICKLIYKHRTKNNINSSLV